MFTNIGKKIMGLAKFVCWAGMVLSVLLGVLIMVSGQSNFTVNGQTTYAPAVLVGILVIIFGVIGSWISSWMTYGFGRLIDNTEALRKDQE